MKIYEPAAEIIEHAFIEYESDPNQFFPNNSIIEVNTNNIPTEINIMKTFMKYYIHRKIMKLTHMI